MSKFIRFTALLAILFFLFQPLMYSWAYPVGGGVDNTGIRRLIRLQRMDSSALVRALPYGARYSIPYVKLGLINDPVDSNLIERDSKLEEDLERLIPNRGRAYSVAVMDITPGRPHRYLERNATAGYQPGSVGKLAVATAIMCELENLFVDSVAQRWELLKNRVVKGGPFAVYDHHTIPDYDPETERYSRPQVNQRHRFTLYEWIDHMLSVSNNGAASVVWREAMLMRVFGQQYLTLSEEEAEAYFETAPRGELRDIANSVVNEPLRHLGIGHDEWRLGTMFTRGGSNIVPPMGGSIGTPRGMIKWLAALESGRVIDAPTSLEIKRLMYMTDRRIRYARAPQLDSAAVYFKSGSLYSCDGGCGGVKYKGTAMNYMNSVAIVEQPDDTRYLVALMSNVRGRNSAYDHLLLASRIDKLLRTTVEEAEREEVPRGVTTD